MIDRGQIAVALDKSITECIDHFLRSFLDEEVARELGCDEPRGRGVARQMIEDLAIGAGIRPIGAEASSEYRLRLRFGALVVEFDSTLAPIDCPARHDLGEIG